MARLRKIGPESVKWIPAVFGLALVLACGVAHVSARPSPNQDQPRERQADLPPIEVKVELPPPLPDVPQSQPEAPSPVVATSGTQELLPQDPPPPPPARQPAGNGVQQKPIGGILEGPILTQPVPEPPPPPDPRPPLPSQNPKPVAPPDTPSPRTPIPTPPVPEGFKPNPTAGAVNQTHESERALKPLSETPVLPPIENTPSITRSGHGNITIKVVDENIRKALELLASQGGVNILPSTGVTGTVTLNLKDVTFDEALDAIVKIGNLGVRREGSLVYVYTAQELSDLDFKKKIPVVRVYCLNYIRASDLAQMITPFLSQEGSLSVTPGNQSGIGSGTAAGTNASNTSSTASLAASGGSVGGAGTGMSGGGAVSSGGTSAAGSTVSTGSDTGGNSLAGGDSMIVRDYAENIAHIDEIVAKLDIQPLQVLIEAVIISVDLNDTQQLGMNFSLVDKLQNVAAVAGDGGLINAAAGFTPAKVLTTAAAVAPSLLPRPGQLVSGYLAPNQGLKFGFISEDVSGFIRAIERINKVNVLASPRVLVLNKQRAEIQLGQRLGYRNTVTNLTSSLQTVQFLSVGTLLSLRPFVSHDGMVRMEIHPEKSTGSLDKDGIPQTNTSELTTNILVPDGATIVIGGLIDSTDSNLQEGVLGLSRLPVVGPLFRDRTTRAVKTELVVLLTPRILNRAGLPQPQPGLAPMGPSGIPNSGPMPGPAVFASRMDSALSTPGETPESDNVQPAVFDVSGPITNTKLRDYGWIGTPPTRDEAPRTDQGVQPASYQPTNPKPAATGAKTPEPARSPDDREIPILVKAAPLQDLDSFGKSPAPEAKAQSKPRYRPGDLTRGLLSRLKAKETTPKPRTGVPPAPTDVASASDAAPREPEVVRTSATIPLATPPKPSPSLPGATGPSNTESVSNPPLRDHVHKVSHHHHPAPVPPRPPRQVEPAPSDTPVRSQVLSNPTGSTGVTYRWHTVQPGENFGSLAKEHYGSASLRSALWQINRHLVPAPEELTPGAMILIPPADVLDRLIQEGTMKSVEEQESADKSNRTGTRRRFRLFSQP